MREWESYLKQNQSRFQEELLALLRIPSISALPAHADDVRRAAEWVAARLSAAGVPTVEVMETGAHPAVYGEWLQQPGLPTVIIYGHFDVQPTDPLELWDTPPFEPTVRDGRVVARGASDSKHNVLLAIAAVEALLATEGALPVNVKFLFEGQEEIGSPQMHTFVTANRERLRCDLVLNSDSLQWSEEEPALLVGLRGLCAAEIEVRGASSDLHSGLYGGAVANPLHALAALIASFHKADGTIAVEGFYDDVVTLSEEERTLLAAVPFDEAEFLAQIGAPALHGEPGFSSYERLWVRPTLEIVGMGGGFQGEGIKTVLPSKAHAKLTCRLAPDQQPARILALLEAHVARHAPPGVTVEFRPRPATGQPYVMPLEHPGNVAARRVLTELYGREPYVMRVGGSVPIVSIFFRELGAHSVSFGFGLPDEQFHAPNEFVRLASFERGQTAFVRLLQTLGEPTAGDQDADG